MRSLPVSFPQASLNSLMVDGGCSSCTIIVKHLPKWLPGIYGFKTFAEKCHLLTDEIKNSLFDAVKLDIASSPPLSDLDLV